jgi:hypothetical protein
LHQELAPAFVPDESSMQDHVPLSESVQDDVADDSAGIPFGPRLRRAVMILSAAIATHLWLVRAPIPVPLSIAQSAVVSQAGLLGLPRHTRENASAAGRSPSVRVQTEFVSVGVSGARHVTIPSEVPVGTTGLMQVRADLPAPSAGFTDTAISSPVATFSSHLLPTLALDETRAVPNEFPEPIPQATTLALASRVEATPLDASNVPAVSPAVDRSAELRKDEETVLRVLHDYTRAFERLDVQAAKAIWPSVDDRALQRAFEQLDGQQLRFASCGVSVSGQDANARCRGEATYRPKVGSRVLRLTEREWTFNLSRDNDTWQIVKATLQ